MARVRLAVVIVALMTALVAGPSWATPQASLKVSVQAVNLPKGYTVFPIVSHKGATSPTWQAVVAPGKSATTAIQPGTYEIGAGVNCALPNHCSIPGTDIPYVSFSVASGKSVSFVIKVSCVISSHYLSCGNSSITSDNAAPPSGGLSQQNPCPKPTFSDQVVVVCNSLLLQEAYAKHQFNVKGRLHLSVASPGSSNPYHSGDMPGMASAIGQPLVNGSTITFTGQTEGATSVFVAVGRVAAKTSYAWVLMVPSGSFRLLRGSMTWRVVWPIPSKAPRLVETLPTDKAIHTFVALYEHARLP